MEKTKGEIHSFASNKKVWGVDCRHGPAIKSTCRSSEDQHQPFTTAAPRSKASDLPRHLHTCTYSHVDIHLHIIKNNKYTFFQKEDR